LNKKNRDLKKLKLYTKALGFKVYFKKSTRNSPGAEWSTNKTITFYMNSKVTKTGLILTWLHEICHEFDFRQRHKTDSEMLYDALAAEDSRRNKLDAKVDKSMRKLILEDETRAASYRQLLRKQLDLESITEADVALDIKLDIWIYTFYYEKGEFPKLKQVSNARKNIISNVTTRRKNDKRNGLIR
jgi:hypothetical protein